MNHFSYALVLNNGTTIFPSHSEVVRCLSRKVKALDPKKLGHIEKHNKAQLELFNKEEVK